MHSVGIIYMTYIVSSGCALPIGPIGLGNLVRDWKDVNPDLDLPAVHLDTSDPVTKPDPGSAGFSWADEWVHGKRSLEDKHHDHFRDAPHKADPLLKVDPGPWTGGMMFKDASEEHKRDLFGGIDPSLLHTDDSIPSQEKGPPKGWMFKDTPRHKRGETLTELVDDVIQPSEANDDSTPDPSPPRPREGWVFADTPHKRDKASDGQVVE